MHARCYLSFLPSFVSKMDRQRILQRLQKWHFFSHDTNLGETVSTNPALLFSAKASIISNWSDRAWLRGFNTLQQIASFSEISPFLVYNPWTAKWERTKFRRGMAVGNVCLFAACRPQMSVWSELTWEREKPAVAVLLTAFSCFPFTSRTVQQWKHLLYPLLLYLCCNSVCG